MNSRYINKTRAHAYTVHTCPFMMKQCMDWCGYHPEGKPDQCTLLNDVPAGEDARDWYLRMCHQLEDELGEVSAHA